MLHRIKVTPQIHNVNYRKVLGTCIGTPGLSIFEELLCFDEGVIGNTMTES